ncbi:MAG TPA: MBL fold metallo-hydrolase [Candidatus Ozemobacteraceae bacterium]
MKILPLTPNPRTYSCIPYLVLGSWNRLEDMNTLVDTGSDAFILGQISGINTGVGKRAVERIVLTHNHFDHTGGVDAIKREYASEVLAWNPSPLVDRLLHDGELLQLGDRTFLVIHAPGHSHDSVCLFCEEDGVLFSGDTPIRIQSPGGTYSEKYIDVLERLAAMNIRTIYPGHDAPITEEPLTLLRRSCLLAKSGTILPADSSEKGGL